jgi:hypothetical protein
MTRAPGTRTASVNASGSIGRRTPPASRAASWPMVMICRPFSRARAASTRGHVPGEPRVHYDSTARPHSSMPPSDRGGRLSDWPSFAGILTCSVSSVNSQTYSPNTVSLIRRISSLFNKPAFITNTSGGPDDQGPSSISRSSCQALIRSCSAANLAG